MRNKLQPSSEIYKINQNPMSQVPPRQVTRVKSPHLSNLALILRGFRWEELFFLDNNQICSIDWRLMTDSVLKDIAMFIRRKLKVHGWKEQRHLYLDFGGLSEITGAGIKSFLSVLNKSLVKLQNLKLALPFCVKIDDHQLEDFLTSYTIKNFVRLQHLACDFHGNEKMTDRSLTSFGREAGRKINSLQHFAISFSSCNKITNEGFIYFWSKFSSYHIELKQLIVYFSGCHRLSDESLEIVGRNMKYLNKLENMTLHFSNCNNMSNAGLKSLVQKIADNLPNIKQLTLDFHSCYQVSKNAKEAFQTMLQHIPELSIN